MPSDWVTYLEILLGGEGDMLMCNTESGYNYGKYFEDALYAAGWSKEDVYKVKIWNSGYPKEPQKGYCTISPEVRLSLSLPLSLPLSLLAQCGSK
jgi:alpha-amylase